MGVVLAVVLAAFAGLVGYHIGQAPAEADVYDQDAIRATFHSMQNANTTEMVVVPYSNQCYGFTGGTCLSKPCDAFRNAKCVDAKCVCARSCTGADGQCRTQSYRKVAGGFTLTNKRFSRSWLYFQTLSLLSQLKVAAEPRWFFGGQQLFDLYELPGTIDGKKQYFLASTKWPSWVAAIRPTGSVLTGSVSLFGLYALNLVHTIAPWDPQQLTLQVCSMKKLGYEKEIMIGRTSVATHRTEWAYVHHGSWFVYGWALSQDPGDEGYWTVSDDKVLKHLDKC